MTPAEGGPSYVTRNPCGVSNAVGDQRTDVANLAGLCFAQNGVSSTLRPGHRHALPSLCTHRAEGSAGGAFACFAACVSWKTIAAISPFVLTPFGRPNGGMMTISASNPWHRTLTVMPTDWRTACISIMRTGARLSSPSSTTTDASAASFFEELGNNAPLSRFTELGASILGFTAFFALFGVGAAGLTGCDRSLGGARFDADTTPSRSIPRA